ncbi:Permease family domain containing protein [Amanita muscaria]
MSKSVVALNDRIANSIVGRWFLLEGCGLPNERKGSWFTVGVSHVSVAALLVFIPLCGVQQTEIRAGLTTWAAMVYIIAVNASILSDSGGTCVCPTSDGCVDDTTYLACVNEVKRDLITTTAAISSLSSILMGLLANLPVALAPGFLSVYFTYSVVGFHGTGMISYRQALAAVFMEGCDIMVQSATALTFFPGRWIFLFLTLLGLRQWLVRVMPQSLVLAVGAGIGLFIALVGLSSGGLNVIGGSTSTYVSIGGCNPGDYVSTSLVGYCNSRVLRSPTMWLGIFTGGMFTVFLMMYRVRGAILIGIFLTAIISWPRPTAVTYFPYTATGDEMFNYFKQVVTFRKLEKIGNALDYNYKYFAFLLTSALQLMTFRAPRNGHVWYALITFLYVDILDTTGTLYSMAKFAGLRDPVTLDFENSTIAYCVDAFCISMGALMGTSPVIAFIESATGISEGGKTGLTAMTTGIAFFVSIFFSPIFASIPSWATGGALVIVGSMMIRNVAEINWNYIGDAVPAFLTLIIIPLTSKSVLLSWSSVFRTLNPTSNNSIAYGVIAGILSYVLLNGTAFILRKLSGGVIVPSNYADAELWVVPPGSIIPIWILKLLGRDRQDPENELESPVEKVSDGDSVAVGHGEQVVSQGGSG